MSSGPSAAEQAAEKEAEESEKLMEAQEAQEEDENKTVMQDQLSGLKRFRSGGASGGSTGSPYGGSNKSLGG